MHSKLGIGAVIPCYGEEEGVREVICRMPQSVDEVVVVDDNCTGRTAEVAKSVRTRVVPERTPCCGAACKAGLRAVQSDIVVALDSDGTYRPEEIKLEALLRGLRFGEDHIPYGVRAGEAKLQRWSDGWGNLVFLLRERFERA